MIIQLENNSLINHLIFCSNFCFNYKHLFYIQRVQSLHCNAETFAACFNIGDAIYRSECMKYKYNFWLPHVLAISNDIPSQKLKQKHVAFKKPWMDYLIQRIYFPHKENDLWSFEMTPPLITTMFGTLCSFIKGDRY